LPLRCIELTLSISLVEASCEEERGDSEFGRIGIGNSETVAVRAVQHWAAGYLIRLTEFEPCCVIHEQLFEVV